MVGQRKRPVAEKESDEFEDDSLTDEDKIRLIGLVQKYPVLWNVKYKGFRDSSQTTNGWRAIAEIMEVDGKLLSIELPVRFYCEVLVDICKKGWQALRKRFGNLKREVEKKTRSGAGFMQKPVWPFWNEMQFIHDTVTRLPYVFCTKYCCNN
jgi:hypothetical protein